MKTTKSEHYLNALKHVKPVKVITIKKQQEDKLRNGTIKYF